MDNIKDENLKRLGKHIANELIELAIQNKVNIDWVKEDTRDHMIGELARCVTLQNLYLDREEYEKCALMKIRIMELSDKLNLPLDTDLTNLEDDEE
jgi:hypothetical protein